MMSTCAYCSICGILYGASWGDVSGLCPTCFVGDTPANVEQENKKLKQEIQDLKCQLGISSFLGEGI